MRRKSLLEEALETTFKGWTDGHWRTFESNWKKWAL